MTTITSTRDYVSALPTTENNAPKDYKVNLNEYEKYCENPKLDTPFGTADGQFKIGMRREAVENTRKFDRIDTDKSGILSETEICDYRDLKAIRKEITHATLKCIGYIGLAGGIALVSVAPPVGLAVFLAGNASLLTGGILDFVDKSETDWEETQEYKEKHGIEIEA